MIYKKNPDCKAVITAVPPYLIAYGVTEAEFNIKMLPESFGVLRDVQKIPYGSGFDYYDEITESICAQSPVRFIENDCVVITGKNILKAYDRLEVAEYTARALFCSLLLGEVNNISDDNLKRIG